MKTDIIAIIDKSASMSGLIPETIQGFNAFIDEQRKIDGECNVTTVLFSGLGNFVASNTGYIETLYTALPLTSVPKMTTEHYRCGGWTALLDAIGTSVDAAGARFASMKEADRPTKVIVMIITDGEENCSRKYTNEQIKSMIKHQEDKYSWEFMFLGANIDSFYVAGNLGMKLDNISNYTANSKGTTVAYEALSFKSASIRGGMDARSINLSAVVADKNININQ